MNKDVRLQLCEELGAILQPCYGGDSPVSDAQAKKALAKVKEVVKSIRVAKNSGDGTGLSSCSMDYLRVLEYLYFELLHGNWSNACNETGKYLHCFDITERRVRDGLVFTLERSGL